jgi:Zn-dependent M28 family amino/carboxypeptidase
MMEAMRILKTTGVRLRRTVRLGLWGGEEQGLLGSKAYVRDRIADVMTMQVKAEHGKVSAYYNLDNGTGRIRGVYLQGNEAVAPVFQAWMEPFRNLGMTTLAIRETSNSDHVAFDAAGIPAFQFIQDPIEYDTRTHHSNQDLHERLLADDLARNAVIIASFIHHTANRDDRLPRKPLPRPQRPPARTTTESGR